MEVILDILMYFLNSFYMAYYNDALQCVLKAQIGEGGGISIWILLQANGLK